MHKTLPYTALVALVVTVVVASSCSAEGNHTFGSDDGVDPTATRFEQGDPLESPDAAHPAACVEAVMRDCRVQLPSQGNAKNCFVGVQVCVQGHWSPCIDEKDVDEYLTTPADS
jgi:hypothetical protein